MPEPPAKRKTLAERAAEPINPSRPHIPAKPSAIRTDSTAFNGESRAPSSLINGHRIDSNASTVSSSGSVRPPSRQTGLRQNTARQPSAQDAAGADEEADSGVMGKRKGTPTFFQPAITLRKTRQQQQADVSTRSQQSGSYIRAVSDGEVPSISQTSRLVPVLPPLSQQEPDGQDSRAVSLSTAFAELSITPKCRKASGPRPMSKHRPSLERIREEVSPSKIPKFSCTPSLRHAQAQQPLRTPSPHKHNAASNGLRTPVTSVKPVEWPVFLTKEKLTPLPAWDTKGRLEDMVGILP